MQPVIQTPEAPPVAPARSVPPLRVLRPRPRKRRGHGWWLLGLAIILISAVAFTWQRREAARRRESQRAAGSVRTATVHVGTLERSLRLTGTTAAEKYVNMVTPYLSGNRGYGMGSFSLILQKLIKPGARVRKGDEIAEFDRQWMLNRLDDYTASVKQDELYLKTLRVALDVRRKYSEQKIRVAKATVDKSELDLKTIPVRSAITAEQLRQAAGDSAAVHQQMLNEPTLLDISDIAAMRRSELQLQLEKLELKRAQTNVEKMLVLAPIDGLVVMQRIYHGSDLSEIQAGDQVSTGQPYLQIVDVRSMIVNADANQADAELVHINAPAHVRVDGYPGLELPAHVYSVGAIAVGLGYRQSWVKTIPVRLKIDRMDPRVIPNFSVSADVILSSEPNALLAPRECIFYDPKPFAYVRGPSGWERRDLELGLANNVTVAVRSGLREGDVIAAQPPPAQ